MKIKSDSRLIKKGDTFIALPGLKSDGHDYVDDAIKKGACKVIVERGIFKVPTIYVSDTQKYLEEYFKEYYQAKLASLILIGVTGTNGKTTSCYLLYQMLNKLNIDTAYIGTLGFYLKDKIMKLNHTTPDLLTLYQLLLQAKKEKIKYVVMEVSSHALKLGRVKGLKFNYAIFTNLSSEHLDFHYHLDDYIASKAKLFKMITNDGLAIINNDDPYQAKIITDGDVLTYGFKESDFTISKEELNDQGTSFILNYNNQEYLIKSPLIGRHNIYNLLTMIIVLFKMGFSLEIIIAKIPLLKAPPGRMDTIIFNDKKVIIDYAHTPDAVFNIIKAVKKLAKGYLYSIIGCGGNRDKSKRSLMTFYAMALSDKVIITSDNPRFEEVETIIDDMLKGNVKNNYQVIIDRKKAIKHGLHLLTKDDILLILGKGHERYQIIGSKKIYHNDKEYVLSIIK